MPRKDFRNHLQQTQAGYLPQNIFDLKEGDDDGTFTFVYESPKAEKTVVIQASISDVGDYPRSHSFFVFAVSDHVPDVISKAIDDLGVIDSLSIESAVKLIANKLNGAANALGKGDDSDDVEMLELLSDDGDVDDGFSDREEADDLMMNFNSQPVTMRDLHKTTSAQNKVSTPSKLSEQELRVFKERVCTDMRKVQKAGFRFAHQGPLLQPEQSCYVMISCRVAKLGIPEDAMKAWYLDRDEYIMLLLHYPSGYRSLDQLPRARRLESSILNMNVAVTKRYKLGISEVIQTFTQVDQKKNTEEELQTKTSAPNTRVRALFMGAALIDLLNTRLLALIEYRRGMNMSWTGAGDFYNDNQGKTVVNEAATDPKYYDGVADKIHAQHLPHLVTSDHLLDRGPDFSFPLLAIQFTLRHIVRCTDFCLVCWCRTGDEFEAMKPYVCSKPLCLYQYITLGFGPSIEFEILTQPYVVDLLVSFCYAGAASNSLKHFPLGLGIQVPHPRLLGHVLDYDQTSWRYRVNQPAVTETKSTPTFKSKTMSAKWDEKNKELVVNDGKSEDIIAGKWICFWDKDHVRRHCKVTETWYPSIRYENLITAAAAADDNSASEYLGAGYQMWQPSPMPQPPTIPKPQPTPPYSGPAQQGGTAQVSTGHSKFPEVTVAVYDSEFDQLTSSEQQAALKMLLDTIPGVLEMRDYLQGKRKQGSLQAWTEQMTPPALSVLRWIIASNRSCIVQPEKLGIESRSDEEQVYGMDGYLQFRFASGAPDKESRFLKCVRDETTRLNLKHPTIFAWHGSPLGNWHSIVREGLNFDKQLHGRAYGDGVYHSLQSMTSLGYSGQSAKAWPSSKLRIRQTLSLNEIVNAPKEFVSCNPHLVVNQIDWIQTRYLFVGCGDAKAMEVCGNATRPTFVLEQDPKMRPVGTSVDQLVIPVTAISKSRRPATKTFVAGAEGNKRSKVSADGQLEAVDMDDLPSELSDDEDCGILQPKLTSKAERYGLLDDEDLVITKVTKKEASREKGPPKDPKTPFTPGNLDRSKLPLLAPPSYATPQASRTLQREIQKLLKVQSSTPLDELGWYFDAEDMENPYQMIVELHSFDLTLPLAKDMIKQKVDSIVIELRFGQNFPMTPPFVRVLTPRFLSFMAGGGGHVTAGGAICMELLTSTGWSPITAFEAILLQVRMAISSTEPRPAKLEPAGAGRTYGVGEAVEAYRRACQTHGWTVPDDFHTMSLMPSAGPSQFEHDVFDQLNPFVTPAPTPAPSVRRWSPFPGSGHPAPQAPPPPPSSTANPFNGMNFR